MVTGLSLFSLLSDCLIERDLVMWIPRKIKRGTSVSYGKVEYDICFKTSDITPYKRWGRVDSTDEITFAQIQQLSSHNWRGYVFYTSANKSLWDGEDTRTDTSKSKSIYYIKSKLMDAQDWI